MEHRRLGHMLPLPRDRHQLLQPTDKRKTKHPNEKATEEEEEEEEEGETHSNGRCPSEPVMSPVTSHGRHREQKQQQERLIARWGGPLEGASAHLL